MVKVFQPENKIILTEKSLPNVIMSLFNIREGNLISYPHFYQYIFARGFMDVLFSKMKILYS